MLWLYTVLLGNLKALLCLVHGRTVSVTVQSEKRRLAGLSGESYLSVCIQTHCFSQDKWQQIYYTRDGRAKEASTLLNIYLCLFISAMCVFKSHNACYPYPWLLTKMKSKRILFPRISHCKN